MAHFNSDPRLSLYDITTSVFAQISSELGHPGITFLSLAEDHEEKRPFHDDTSTFEADEFVLHSIEQRDVGTISIGINLFKGGLPYARQKDLVGPFRQKIQSTSNSHLVVATSDGPPLIMHNDYFASVENSAAELPPYFAAGYAEVLSFNRAAYVQRALGQLAAEQIDPEFLA